MPRTPLDVTVAVLAAVLFGVAVLLSPIAAAAIAVVAASLVLAGSRRVAVATLCVLAALAVAGVRVDASHRNPAPDAGHR